MKSLIFIVGCVALAALWFGPLPSMTGRSFAAHMLLHMGVVAVAAPLIAIGAAGGRFDLVLRAPRLFSPIPLSIVELIVVWAWHAPGLHHFARANLAGFLAEQVSFFAAGLAVWISAFGGDAGMRPQRAGAGVAALLLTSMHMTLLGALLALTPRVLYVHAGHTSHSALTSLDDQHLGGAIMIAIGGVAYLVGGLWLTAGLVRRRIVPREVGA